MNACNIMDSDDRISPKKIYLKKKKPLIEYESPEMIFLSVNLLKNFNRLFAVTKTSNVKWMKAVDVNTQTEIRNKPRKKKKTKNLFSMQHNEVKVD